MTLDADEAPAGPDPFFRSTYLCFQRALADNARIVGHWLAEVMYEGHALDTDLSNRRRLRAVALDLLHLERFAAAGLDLGAARPKILCLVSLIGAALKRSIAPPGRTPAFRETILLQLPREAQRVVRWLGVYLQAALAEASAERHPGRARQGVIAELAFLSAYLRLEVADTAATTFLTKSEHRLAGFAGRMADRLEKLAQSIGHTEEP